jgi:hypothetical protein
MRRRTPSPFIPALRYFDGLTGSFRVQTQLIQYATMAAMWTAAKKFLASLS